jgi:outer membrane lipoprotein-sorting protein
MTAKRHIGSLLATAIAASGILLPLTLAGGDARAADTAQLSVEDQADLKRVEDLLNGIRTLRSEFLQSNPDGSLARGTFYMQRPGKMRIEYEPPNRNYIVSDGWFVYFWDDELKQQSNAPLGSTIADLILRDGLRLSGDLAVTDIRRGPGSLEVEVVEAKDPGKGRLTLVFEDNPLRLRKWRVLDAQGMTTEVALMNPQTGLELDRGLFVFHNPNFGKRRD